MKYDFKENYGRAIEGLYSDLKLREGKERDVRRKCYEYLNNWVDGEHGQWPNAIRQLLGADKPALSFNEIRRLVNRVRGAIPELDERCFPVDDESDWILAEIFTDLLKQVRNDNNSETVFKQGFSDSYIGGSGFVRVEWSNDKDIFGSIVYRYLDPRNVFLVGNGVQLDLTDRLGVLELIPMEREEIQSRWPGKADEVGGLSKGDISVNTSSDNDYGLHGTQDWTQIYDEDEDRFIVKRLQRYEWVNATVIESGGKYTPTVLEGEELKQAIELMKMQGIDAKKTTVKRKKVKCYYSIGGIELETHWSKYRHGFFDIAPMICYMDGGRITGVVQDLLDPQDEKNKRRSQMINILNSSASGSFIAYKGAFDDPDAVQKQLGKPRQILMSNIPVAEAMKPIDQNLTAIPALVNMEMQSVEDMKDISGLHDAALGEVPAGVKSGRGISALQMPTETIINELVTHYVFFRKQIARMTISLIQQFYTEERRIRVLGDYHSKYMPEDAQVKALMEQGLIKYEDGAKFIIVNRQGLEKKLNDVSVGKFDVVIDTTVANPTMRRQQYFDYLNAMQQGAPIKWSTAMKYSDIRGKAEALRDIQEAESFMQQAMNMPPQLTPRGAQGGSPPAEQDILGNTSGAQQP
jgi:hypothetical protein